MLERFSNIYQNTVYNLDTDRPELTEQLPNRLKIASELVGNENPTVPAMALEKQREVITTLHVGNIESELPPNLYKIYSEFGGTMKPRSFLLEDNSEVEINSTENGIVTIRRMKKSKPLLFFIPVYRIEDFFIVDRENKKVWDVSQLWKKDKTLNIVSIPALVNSSFVPTRDGNYLILNRISDHLNFQHQRENMTELNPAVLDFIIPPHENAHNNQFINNKKSNNTLTSALIKSYITHKIQRPLFKIAEFFGQSELIRKVKARMVENERNAHAFALSVFRNLRQKGLDVFINIPLSEIFKTVNFALETYDQSLSFMKGPAFSKDKRKRERNISANPIRNNPLHARKPNFA